jgi:hypothetical protein
MSTIASLLALMDPEQKPWSEGVESVNRAERGRQLNETGLIEMAERKRQQQTEALVRQRLQQNPGLLLDPGGSTLASPALTMPPGGGPMTQQTVLPGQPPGAPQPVPGGQDLSQFATGGPSQSTLAGLAHPPRQNPLEALIRENPEMGLKIMQMQQAQQDRQWNLEEQALNRREKVAGALGQIFQGVSDQDGWSNAISQVQRFAPELAAQLPPLYTKEVAQRLVKQSVSAKDNASLQLETLRTNAEIGKLNVQLANAGYQGLGDDVTSILKGLTPEQVEQFGGRTSAKAIAYATEEARKLKAPPGQTADMTTELRRMGKDPWKASEQDLTQAGENIETRKQANLTAEQRLKFAQEEKLRETQPLQDARKEDAGLFVYRGTGNTLPGTMPYGQTKQLQDEKDPEKGAIKLANLDEKKQLTTLKQLEPVLQQYADLVQYAYGTDPKTGKKGPLADYQRSPSDVITAMYGQLEQSDPVFQAKRRALQGQLQSVVRGLGARGDLNEAELKAAQEMIANMDASMGLGLGLGVGAGGGGLMFGAKPTISIPDSPATGVALANELIGTVNRRIGSILQHEGYAKTPTITLQTATAPQTTSGTTPPTVTTPAPPTPAPAGTPPAKPKGRQPGEIPVLGGPGMPEQYLPPPGKRSSADLPGAPKVANLTDVAEAMRQTGKDRKTVEKAMRDKGYIVYGSKLPIESALA